jgi:hypothetical protein
MALFNYELKQLGIDELPKSYITDLEAKYKELLEFHNELLKTLENSRSFMTAHIPEKIFDMIDETIEKAKNIKQ